MTLPTVPQLFLLCLFWFLGPWSTTDASPFNQWEDGVALRKVRGIQSDDMSDVLWRDQDEEQVQNVFKRFLFHYSKARNSVGTVQHESHSVHPLLRLSPKLSQRRNKKVVLVPNGEDPNTRRFEGCPRGCCRRQIQQNKKEKWLNPKGSRRRPTLDRNMISVNRK